MEPSALHLVTSLVLFVALDPAAVTSEDRHDVPRQQDAGQLISLLSSLAAQGGVADLPQLLQQVPGAGGSLQLPSSAVGQLLGGYLPAPGPGQYPQQQQGGADLVSALTAIAAYDDLQCVPRLLCEVAAGGRPGQSAKQDSLIPFLSKDTLVTLLTIFNLGGTSPLLVFGRAVLLGVTAQGRPSACLSAYPTCPRDPDQLVYYLNNHRGGFFQFFNNLRRPPVLRPHQGRIQNYHQGLRETPTTPSPPTITAPPPPPPVRHEFPREQDFQFYFKESPPAADFRKQRLLKFPVGKEGSQQVHNSFVHSPGTSFGQDFSFPQNEVEAFEHQDYQQPNEFQKDVLQYPGQNFQFPFKKEKLPAADFRKGRLLKFPAGEEWNHIAHSSFTHALGTSIGDVFSFPGDEVEEPVPSSEGFQHGKAVSFPSDALGSPGEADGPPGVSEGSRRLRTMVFPDSAGDLRTAEQVLWTGGRPGRELRFPTSDKEEVVAGRRDLGQELAELSQNPEAKNTGVPSEQPHAFPQDRKS